jgi:hypothetical protein
VIDYEEVTIGLFPIPEINNLPGPAGIHRLAGVNVAAAGNVYAMVIFI